MLGYIAFIMSSSRTPSTTKKKKRRLEETSTAKNLVEEKRRLEEVRKNLPVYPYRERLIRAIVGNAPVRRPESTNKKKKKNSNTAASSFKHHSIRHNHHEDEDSNDENDDKAVLITASTGSGKSTQIPWYVLEEKTFQGRIAVTQPRRVAAITLAQRVAQETGTKVGSKVGYRVRFEDCTHPTETKLVYLTDGMLLREAMVDPLLNRYNVIFLDESHERSLQTDILLGVVKRACRNRRQQGPSRAAARLRVVVMSATLQIDTFQAFFGGPDHVTILSIPGRQYPVELVYTKKHVEEYIDAALSTVLQIHFHETEESGDILVFLPGQEEIEDLAALLRYHLEEEDKERQWTGDRVVVFQGNKTLGPGWFYVGNVLICLLYASLPPEAQMVAFQQRSEGCARKIVLATNIAETSVTLPGIRFVVDTGKHKCRQIVSTGMETLKVENVSQAQAAQRAGRAGRVESGTCFRLYTQDALESLNVESIPEIQRVNLAQVVLQLKSMGITDPASFDFVSPPGTAALIRATKQLFGLRALDNTMELTEHGKKLAKLPLDPVFGHLLLQGNEYDCLNDMMTAVAVLSAENLFYRPSSSGGSGSGSSEKAASMHRRFVSYEGDLPTSINVYEAWQSEAVYVPPSSGGLKMQKRLVHTKNEREGKHSGLVLSHGEWCKQNFVSGRALVRAESIRQQLLAICGRSLDQNGLGMNAIDSTSSGGNGGNKDRENFLRAVAAGLFLQAASRIKPSLDTAKDRHRGGRSGDVLQNERVRYRTKLGHEAVSVHPSSALFGRNPAPSCVVYTELITSKKTYIRGVTQIREAWLQEVAPDFYPTT